MGAGAVEVVAPCCNQITGMAQAVERVLVQTSIPHPAIECFNKPGLQGLVGAMQCHSHLALLAISGPALPVSSVPLSETAMQGWPRIWASRSTSRLTRKPYADVSAPAARHSRPKSSITLRMRNRLSQNRLSDTKSSLHRWFGPCAFTIGALALRASFGPPRSRIVSTHPSSAWPTAC